MGDRAAQPGDGAVRFVYDAIRRLWPHKVATARKDAGSNGSYVLPVNRSLFCEVAANIEPRFVLMRFIKEKRNVHVSEFPKG